MLNTHPKTQSPLGIGFLVQIDDYDRFTGLGTLSGVVSLCQGVSGSCGSDIADENESATETLCVASVSDNPGSLNYLLSQIQMTPSHLSMRGGVPSVTELGTLLAAVSWSRVRGTQSRCLWAFRQ